MNESRWIQRSALLLNKVFELHVTLSVMVGRRYPRSMLINTYVVLLALFGVVVLFTAWLPMLLKDVPLSLPMICIAFGTLFVWT
ncbi:hypothetical protein FHS21_005025, partial [Phyllobacterium trifolii]|nr:hypothetical protein [Phyllobacterium trifolii]